MKTLLIGLDNPYSRNPHHALLPMPDGATGNKIVRLIDEVTVTDYSAAKYLRDFARLNLYPGEAARSGRGATATDRLLARLCMILIHQAKYKSVVLFGKRVQVAFADFVQLDGDTDIKAVVGADCTIYFHALPHPSGRNRWYTVPENRQHAARILESLRDRR